jgi:hypothetical protein
MWLSHTLDKSITEEVEVVTLVMPAILTKRISEKAMSLDSDLTNPKNYFSQNGLIRDT